MNIPLWSLIRNIEEGDYSFGEVADESVRLLIYDRAVITLGLRHAGPEPYITTVMEVTTPTGKHDEDSHLALLLTQALTYGDIEHNIERALRAMARGVPAEVVAQADGDGGEDDGA